MPTPSPTVPPTPLPVPTPFPLTFPLRVAGHRFLDAEGHPIQLLGAVSTDKRAGWPLVNELALDEYAAHFANWTHIRLGPHSDAGSDRDTTPVSPDFESRVRSAIRWAEMAGIAVEVDVIDGWVLEKELNFYGWTRDIVLRSPTLRQREWVRYVAALTRDFGNVVYQVSNESFDIGVTPEWELGILAELRAHAPGRLVSTNSHLPEIEKKMDYVNRHLRDGPFPAPLWNKPTAVNESGPVQTPEQWEQRARAAEDAGTIYHAWRGDMTDPQWADTLLRLERVREETGA